MFEWESLSFWNGQNGLDFNIYVLSLVFAAFLHWKILFGLHLNFYICIPWVNKLLVTFEKQISLNELISKAVER